MPGRQTGDSELLAREAVTRGLTGAVAPGFRNLPGHGTVVCVDARRVVVGSRRLMADEGVELESLLANGTRWPRPADGRAVHHHGSRGGLTNNAGMMRGCGATPCAGLRTREPGQ